MKYELLYIIPATKTDNEVEKAKDAVSALIQKLSESVIRHDVLGKIKLAYPIRGIRYGHYGLAWFASDAENIKHLDEELRHIGGDVMRHVICRMQPGAETKPVQLTEYEIPDVFKKHRPYRKSEKIDVPLQAQKPVTPMSEQELEKKIDEILESDIEKL